MPSNEGFDRKTFENVFPKTCTVCGKVYSTCDEFLSKTSSLDRGDLSQGPKNSVLAYRNCDCGSTLTIKLEDLRDYSPEGIKRREEFRKRLKQVKETEGLDDQEAVAKVKKEMGF